MRSSLFVCALALIATACDKGDDSSSGSDDSSTGDDSGTDDSGTDDSSASVDADNDGYDSAEDCDDANADVNPGATEVCDEIDNNCVDGVDEGVTTPFYPDTDGDTYGAGTAVDACTVPKGHVENADDCDDTTAAANPGATEVCDEIDNNCVDGIDEGVTMPFYADGDADGFGAGTAMDACAAPTGYVDNADDCDDLDAVVNPDADEVCDTIDNDCDTDIDDDDSGVTGTSTFYRDNDGDGYGYPHWHTVTACEMPTGYVDNGDDCNDYDSAWHEYEWGYYDFDYDGYGLDKYYYEFCYSADYIADVGGDCDDSNDAVNPGAPEVCDELDNDCNTLVDLDDKGVVDGTWYADADADGYGDDSTATDTCDPVDGYVPTGGDCDDAAYLVSPGRSEYCDGIDNNCDGAADETTDYVDWYRDDDGDHYGQDGDVMNDCAPPKGYDLLGGDCDDTNADVNPGAEEDALGDDVDGDCDGYVDNGNFDLDDAMFSISGNVSYTYVGYSVGSGDLNGDGYDELLVGSPYANSYYGAIYVVNGPATGGITVSDADANISGQTFGSWATEYLGSSVTAGDVDGDGYDDLLAAGAWSAHVSMFLGPVSSTTTASADVTFTPTASYSSFGQAIAMADLDGDSYLDTAIAEPYDSTYYGAVSVFMGPVSGAASSDLVVTGLTMYDGAVVANVGDADGDGLDDLAMGQPYGGASDQGEVYLLDPGSSTGSVTASSITVATMTGELSYKNFGYKVAGGDFNNDGYADLFASAPYYDEGTSPYYVGRVYGWLGPVSGAYAGSTADVMVTGDVQYAYLGYELTTGDVRGDSADEVLIGHPYTDDYIGKGYVLDGPTTGSIDLSSMTTMGKPDDAAGPYGSSGYVGWAMGAIGDWSGDGTDDVIVSAYGLSAGLNSYAGRAWVVASDDL